MINILMIPKLAKILGFNYIYTQPGGLPPIKAEQYTQVHLEKFNM